MLHRISLGPSAGRETVGPDSQTPASATASAVASEDSAAASSPQTPATAWETLPLFIDDQTVNAEETSLAVRARGWEYIHLRYPRITMVTALRNGERYVEETIRSVVQQGYPDLEYLVVDGASTDGTIDIIKKYEKYFTDWISEPDGGVYDAINKGFARATGEIMGWLNASDLLHTNGLFVVGSVFAALPEVEWITGKPTRFNAHGLTIDVRKLPRWSQRRFLAGANQFIQQESTFWRRSLWNRSGGALSTKYRAAGDFELWVRFFRHAQLHSVNALIGGYRSHENALSSSDIARYVAVCDEIAEREVTDLPHNAPVKLFRWINRVVQHVPKLRGLWYRLAMRGLYSVRGGDWPATIEDHQNEWVMRP